MVYYPWMVTQTLASSSSTVHTRSYKFECITPIWRVESKPRLPSHMYSRSFFLLIKGVYYAGDCYIRISINIIYIIYNNIYNIYYTIYSTNCTEILREQTLVCLDAISNASRSVSLHRGNVRTQEAVRSQACVLSVACCRYCQRRLCNHFVAMAGRSEWIRPRVGGGTFVCIDTVDLGLTAKCGVNLSSLNLDLRGHSY